MAINFNLVSQTQKASAVFVEQENVNRGTGSAVIERKILVVGQFNSGKNPKANEPQLILSKSDASSRYGYGSMLARSISLALDSANSIPVYALPLADNLGGIASAGQITVSGTATESGVVAIYVGGLRILAPVEKGDTSSVIASTIASTIANILELPVTQTLGGSTVTLTAKWKGESGNQIQLASNFQNTDKTPGGIGIAIQDIGAKTLGQNDPDPRPALNSLGNDWFTDIAIPYTNKTTLKYFAEAGDKRIEPDIKRPFCGFVGWNKNNVSAFISELGNHNSQWLTIIPVFGSPTPSFEISAIVTASFARYQSASPGRPMKGIKLTGVLAGTKNNQLNKINNQIVGAGGSHTVNNQDETVSIGDLVTTKTTDNGTPTEDWQFSIIVANIQYKINSLEIMAKGSPFDRGLVAEDGSGAGTEYTIRPSTVKAYAVALVDTWISLGLSTAREKIIDGIRAEIDSENAGRINLLVPDIPSAGLRILAAKLEWAYLV